MREYMSARTGLNSCDARRLLPSSKPQATVREAIVGPSPVPPTHRRGDARSSRRAGGRFGGTDWFAGRLHPGLLESRRPPLALRAISPTAWWRMPESPARTFSQIVIIGTTSNPGPTMRSRK